MDDEASALEEYQLRYLHHVVNCDKKEDTDEVGDVFSQTSQTHDVIRELDKITSSLEVQLASARASKSNNNEGSLVDIKLGSKECQKVFSLMGIMTAVSSRKRRYSIRETWMPGGDELKKLETEKGIIMRFVIGLSASTGGVLDRAIEEEDEQHKDFFPTGKLSTVFTLIRVAAYQQKLNAYYEKKV